MKYWIKGNKKNPRGVLQALLDVGHKLDKNGVLSEDDPAWGDPNEVFYTCPDAWGKGMYINHYPKSNLYVHGIINDPQNVQLKPVKTSKCILHLTLDEIDILRTLLMEAKDRMEYDKDMGLYTDGGRFVVSFSKAEYETLMRINL